MKILGWTQRLVVPGVLVSATSVVAADGLLQMRSDFFDEAPTGSASTITSKPTGRGPQTTAFRWGETVNKIDTTGGFVSDSLGVFYG